MGSSGDPYTGKRLALARRRAAGSGSNGLGFVRPWPRASRPLGLILPLLLTAVPGPVSSGPPLLHPVPEATAIVGASACTECHEAETEIWQETRHYEGGKLLARDKDAQQIAKALAVSRVKSDERCTSCHFTVQQVDGSAARAVGGVSCESCHGAARDWLEAHSDFGGADVTRETESASHRSARVATCDRAGMNRPARIYRIGRQCYACHTVGDEELVNLGGHSTGAGFELVSWSQGDIRHNFVRGDGGANPESSRERKRAMYVVGQALELEYALRALSRSATAGAYRNGMLDRARNAVESLRKIQAAVPSPQVESVLAVADGLDLSSKTSVGFAAAAAKIGAATERFAAEHDGAKLAPIDALVPPSDAYSGNPTR